MEKLVWFTGLNEYMQTESHISNTTHVWFNTINKAATIVVKVYLNELKTYTIE